MKGNMMVGIAIIGVLALLLFIQPTGEIIRYDSDTTRYSNDYFNGCGLVYSASLLGGTIDENRITQLTNECNAKGHTPYRVRGYWCAVLSNDGSCPATTQTGPSSYEAVFQQYDRVHLYCCPPAEVTQPVTIEEDASGTEVIAPVEDNQVVVVGSDTTVTTTQPVTTQPTRNILMDIWNCILNLISRFTG